ncbi:16S rRNA (adenine(1518)-N(6)/adenine(1519)-N(6))-dimethyltransferase RsmA [Aureibacter tunicatorum]|uniref:Ribosomal RNA small subunit methyltransferase A n=1 Tax=Aureibacter tunicatorum TaxID=866807 RepID=A0AAE3XSM4_9BACT|nr:16S rRNA (adenine(1518)-N(6)/adenine(1519)-N(6))-dimethyltransferase RsmA [Aureibacter tunicatorum]MDR6241260.1 16S rRNA (adenine1518-N6/adenine1519-N6)-dimethyltransferase [Aureibacter tunicatorum]BDD03520.1 ribosomal RNA small subunit methyltransferase A [Aureibacter tunicatorum]
MKQVRAKKHLGQHFLEDLMIAENIVDSLTGHGGYKQVLEVGPGMGVLTQFLVPKRDYETTLVDIDKESIAYLNERFPMLRGRIIDGDFLRMNFKEMFDPKMAIIGNFPYNISSQIFFKILENKDQVTEAVGMVQKEVAERIASPPRKKAYGILSVFLQAYFDVEYLFTVGPEVFTPPPKVDSAVLRLRRNNVEKLDCDEKLFFRVVKQGFQNRRKTLRNALKPMGLSDELREDEVLSLRAEQLSVQDFVDLTNKIANS